MKFNSTTGDSGHTVLDPIGGTGSTLVANLLPEESWRVKMANNNDWQALQKIFLLGASERATNLRSIFII